ncbi:Uncharacterised protein [Neisseria meningitidis]|nr:hypothetical protein NM518_0927 [Neisseria meningitidis NM518]CWO46995.1 Uncharacterised protein [Neisseria meningitidis]CWQ18375.1 Uncharacterised protein [Neisseria meningitidis]CWQ35672.1 Uncharacterised protein [Neisseria meningitidis]CWT03183.1 Uncharacterised protein [Neisseria meningitidis]
MSCRSRPHSAKPYRSFQISAFDCCYQKNHYRDLTTPDPACTLHQKNQVLGQFALFLSLSNHRETALASTPNPDLQRCNQYLSTQLKQYCADLRNAPLHNQHHPNLTYTWIHRICCPLICICALCQNLEFLPAFCLIHTCIQHQKIKGNRKLSVKYLHGM